MLFLVKDIRILFEKFNSSFDIGRAHQQAFFISYNLEDFDLVDAYLTCLHLNFDHY